MLRPTELDPSDEEILTKFGGMIWEFLQDVATDPRTLTEMINAADKITRKNAYWEDYRTRSQLVKPRQAEVA